jgi:hypothetical protein
VDLVELVAALLRRCIGPLSPRDLAAADGKQLPARRDDASVLHPPTDHSLHPLPKLTLTAICVFVFLPVR